MIYLCLRFLRFLREFEKWSELGKMGENGEKMAVLEYPINILLGSYLGFARAHPILHRNKEGNL